ncbi:MAG: sodium:solute symporter [Cytophagales bacterium]|nr:sodium:solute symporter [Cytophagales bacterium]MDW8383874.1 sodium:solute symporter [Flammeovirgaceae bacterium]
MSPLGVLLLISVYFLLIVLIAYLTTRGQADSNFTFFRANRKAPWTAVAFGMIGASLSGVTFISVPGWVKTTGWTYMQMVMGYLAGYGVIAFVLLPIYYKLNLISIYTYLEKRFGNITYLTGASFFILSRLIGASFRLFLVAKVLQMFLFEELQIPFVWNVIGTVILIWLYTFRGGIQTVLWTDVFQTIFMLLSVIITIYLVTKQLSIDWNEIPSWIAQSKYSFMLVWDWTSKQFFVKQFLGGMFIAIAMTGLDQDMMQKNLTCKTLQDAQRNMITFSVSLLPVNILFLSLGVVLWHYHDSLGLSLQGDELFPFLAKHHLGTFAAIVFLIGVIAAAYSSADSALTALTTSFYIDILKIEKKYLSTNQKLIFRKVIHVGFSLAMMMIIIGFEKFGNKTVIEAIFKAASYTYGPLLGIFSFGIFTSYSLREPFVPLVAFIAPILCFVLEQKAPAWLAGYTLGVELLIINGLLTFLGLWIIKSRT